MKTRNGSTGTQNDYITRKGIFKYLWMDGQLTEEHRKYIWNKYPVLYRLESCVKEFRHVFAQKNMPALYLFIQKYKDADIRELASFAKGLQRDIEAVENAVASDLSNGFVEGINSKLKMIKRTMYGRCSKELLTAKLMYEKPT
jgi:transposase